MSGNRATRLLSALGAPPKEPSGNLVAPKVSEQVGEAPEPVTAPLGPSKHDGGAAKRTMLPGSQAVPERKSVADFVDGRTLRSTGRVRPLNLALSDEIQDEFRSEAARRRLERLGKHCFNDLFELAWAAYKRENGLK